MSKRSWIGLVALAAGSVVLLQLLKEPRKAVSLASPKEVEAPEARRVSEELEEPQQSSSDPRSQRTSIADSPVDSTIQETEPGLAELAGKPDKLAAIRGRVLDVLGEPIFFLNVRWTDAAEKVLATSDAAGRFTFETDRTRGTLVAEGDGYVPVGASLVALHTLQSEHLLICAIGRRVSGVVMDGTGSGLAASLNSSCQALQSFPEPLDATAWVHNVSSKTDSTGRFALEGIPDVEGVVLRASSEGYAEATVEIPRGEAELKVVLVRLQEAKPLAITGIVLLPDRNPAVGARVAFAQQAATTDEQGSFHLPVEWSRPEMPLAAGLEGYGSAMLPRFGEVIAEASPLAPQPVTLVLGPQPLSIAGIVVDSKESPLEGWMVSVADGTQVSQDMVPIVYAEGLGGALKSKTGKDGTFRVTGLFDRSYILRAHDPETLVAFETNPLPAGDQHVRIKIPGDVAFARVSGAVVSRTGKPVPGARVRLALVTQQSGGAVQFEARNDVLSDEHGAFEFLDVPRSGAFLQVRGEAVMPTELDLSTEEDLTDITIEVAARCDFRIQVTGRNDRLYVQVLDAAGVSLSMSVFTAHGSSSSTSRQLEGGTMPVCAVSEEATTLVLVEGTGEKTREIHRQPIALVPGVVTEIRVDL